MTSSGRRGPGRPALAVGVMVVGALVTVFGSLLPWVRTGGTRRHSYDLFELVGRLGFAPDGPAAAALRWWPLVPLLAVGAAVVAWWGWPRAGGAVGLAAAVYAGAVGLTVSVAPNAVVDVEPGAQTTAVGAAILLAGSGACIVVGAQQATRRATRPTDLSG